ncbi:hypothetical protein ABVK25_003051 [Lepraria finkii]|uniref:Uncharacterized protein n=1 Tax=Lepraria finkii TaxID=1340010 RepID=A0ABR4BGW2_9LECA
MHRFKREISQTTSLQSPGIEVTQRSRGDIAKTTPFHAQNLGGKHSRMGCKPPKLYQFGVRKSKKCTAPAEPHPQILPFGDSSLGEMQSPRSYSANHLATATPP